MSHGYWTYVAFQVMYLSLGVFFVYKSLQKLDIIIKLIESK